MCCKKFLTFIYLLCLSFCFVSANCSRHQPEEPAAAKKRRIDPFAELRDGAVSSESVSTGAANARNRQSVREELARYKALKVPAESSGPLQFWKEQACDYPVLSEVARRVLSISASSAQSERDFSSVGKTITDVRSRLAASKVESVELVRWGMRAGLQM